MWSRQPPGTIAIGSATLTYIRWPSKPPTSHPIPMSTTSASSGIGYPDAVEFLYSSFADVAHRPEMPRCEHCVSEADVSSLGAEVRSLDAALVARFVTKAGTTWGHAEDLRRVAPRALHLASEHALPVNRSVVLHKLASADWAGWPAHQVDALCRFLIAEWDRILDSPPRPAHAAHRWIRQTASATADLTPFLQAWQRRLADAPGTPAVHLSVLLVNSELRPDLPESVTALFDPRPGDPKRSPAPTKAGLATQLASWLDTPSTEANLARAASALAHTADARRLSLAVDRLRRFRTARSRTV